MRRSEPVRGGRAVGIVWCRACSADAGGWPPHAGEEARARRPRRPGRTSREILPRPGNRQCPSVASGPGQPSESGGKASCGPTAGREPGSGGCGRAEECALGGHPRRGGCDGVAGSSTGVRTGGTRPSEQRSRRGIPDCGGLAWNAGGEGGIRTLEGLAPLTVFETARFNHSRTSPGPCLHDLRPFPQVGSAPNGFRLGSLRRRSLGGMPTNSPMRSGAQESERPQPSGHRLGSPSRSCHRHPRPAARSPHPPASETRTCNDRSR